MFGPRLRVLAGAVGVDLDEGPGRVATQTLTFMLTSRELDVLVVQGLSNPGIAGRLVAGEHAGPPPWQTWWASSASPAVPRPWPGPCAPVWCEPPGRSGICRGRVKLAGPGEATTLRGRVSLVGRAAPGLDQAGPVGPRYLRRTWPQHRTPSGRWRNHACPGVCAQAQREPRLEAAPAASWPASARPRGWLGASVPALVDAPGAGVMARPEEHQTGGKGHEYHTAA
jgi:hypothetical protein